VAVVKPGRIMFEMAGMYEATARQALEAGGAQAAHSDEIRLSHGRNLAMRRRIEKIREEA